MDRKVSNILIPFIVGVVGLTIGYCIGTAGSRNQLLQKQKTIELLRNELNYAQTEFMNVQADSLYLLSNVVWKKQDLKSKVYSSMFDELQAANISRLRGHGSLNNPYWQEINILLLKLLPYRETKIKTAIIQNSKQDTIRLFRLYKDLLQIQRDVITVIGGDDFEIRQLNASTNVRLAKLEEKDLTYLQNNNIWDMDSIWSEKYINFMIGMLSGNVKVFAHKEINNNLWQKIVALSGYKEEYSYRNTRAMLLDASNQQNVNLSKLLYELMTGKKVVHLKDKTKEDKQGNSKKSKENYKKMDHISSADNF